MKRPIHAMMYLAGLIALALSPAAGAQDLAAEDLRLLEIAERIQLANAPLCDRQGPALGVSLQSRDQFRGPNPGFAAEVGFATILPNSIASRAGIVEGDGLSAIGGRSVAPLPGLQDMPLRDSAHAMLSEARMGEPLRLTVISQGAAREVELFPPAQCRALVEVLAEGGSAARSDGRVIQLGLGLMRRASEAEIAVVFAHELAHSVLRHRERLGREGVSKGLAGEFGRDRQLNAQAEIEADRLSVHLLANAGYDPRIAPAFWRGVLGREIGGGLFRSRIYASPAERSAMLEREIADYLAGGPPSWPGHLLSKR